MSDRDFGGLDELLNRIEHLAGDPSTAGEARKLVTAVLTVLGSGPSIAKIQAILASDGMNGPLEQGPVTQQQRQTILNMVEMAKIVREMLDSPG